MTLYHITSHHIASHHIPIRYDPRVVSDLDLPADLFRAQLVCEALNTCGAYYVRGQAKERLSRYLVYFQRYLLSKPLLPTHIEFAILDTFDNLEELARSAAIASAVKLKSAAPALKVIKSLSHSLAVFFNSCYPLSFFLFSPFFFTNFIFRPTTLLFTISFAHLPTIFLIFLLCSPTSSILTGEEHSLCTRCLESCSNNRNPECWPSLPSL